jgi:hypothetical protein
MGESEMWLTCIGEKYSVCIVSEERDARAPIFMRQSGLG